MKKVIQMLVLLSFIFFIVKIDVKASNETILNNQFMSQDIIRGENGDLYFYTKDKSMTSKIGYETIGYTITKCEKGTKTPVDSIYFELGFTSKAEHTSGGITRVVFVAKEAEIMKKIAMCDPEWLKDIENAMSGDGSAVWLKFDAIMITNNYNLKDDEVKSGSWIDDGTVHGYYDKNRLNDKPFVYNKKTKDLLKTAYAWANPSGIDTHFDKYLLYAGGEKEPEEPPLIFQEGVRLYSEFGDYLLKCYMWNHSDEYNLYEAIPSGEDILAGYGADTWRAKYVVYKYNEKRDYKVRFTYELVRKEPVYSHIIDPITGEVTIDPDAPYTEIEVSYGYDMYEVLVPREATYFFSPYLVVNELDTVVTYNGTYNKGHIVWESNRPKITIDYLNDGVRKSSGGAVATTDTTKHIEWDSRLIRYIDLGKVNIDEVETLKGTWAYEANSKYISGVKVWNDTLIINGKKYLDPTPVVGAESAIAPEPTRPAEEDYLLKEESKIETIDKTTPNGSYLSAIELLYNSYDFSKGGDVPLLRGYRLEGDTLKLKPGYEKNEPVYVHTPVVSPVHIVGDSSTQLINENFTDSVGTDIWGRAGDLKAVAELHLDGTYKIDFTQALHRLIKGYAGSIEEANLYNKHTLSREIRFPFDVAIYDKNYRVNSDGYTDWIKVKGETPNVDKEVSFYIPPWAYENTSTSLSGNIGKKTDMGIYEIEVRVSANNLEDKFGAFHGLQDEPRANVTTTPTNEGINYVASFVIPVEVSGVIYDFMIVGASDRDKFVKFSPNLGDTYDMSFARRREEKRTSIYNRFGNKAIRYTLDGEITYGWNSLADTLPLANGSSRSEDEWATGVLKKETIISFSLKTIANLWDKNIDKIDITPTFRYIEKNGNIVTEQEDMLIYYETNVEPLVEYGSPRDDIHIRDVVFNTPRFEGAVLDDHNGLRITTNEFFTGGKFGNYHDEDLSFSVAYDKAPETKLDDGTYSIWDKITHKYPSYNLSKIVLDHNLRNLTGNLEELRINENNNRSALIAPQMENVNEIEFKRSMQTWFGEYYLPGEMYFVKIQTLIDMGIVDKNGDGRITLVDYSMQTGNRIFYTEDFWINPKGKWNNDYIVLNFDIKSTNDNNPHLTYYGGTNNMWHTSDDKTTVFAGYDGELITGTVENGKMTEIELRNGDVAVIYADQRISDAFVAQPLFIE